MTDDDTQAAYRQLLSVLDHTTGHTQPPLRYREPFRAHVIRCGYATSTVRGALEVARKRGDVFRWRDDETDRYYVGLDDADALREKVSTHAVAGSPPNRRLIGVANQRIASLTDGEGAVVTDGGEQ